jgi:hypothetical protein
VRRTSERRPAGEHLAQARPIECDHVGRLGGDAGGDRRLAREHGDIPDECSAVCLCEPDLLVRPPVEEVDKPSLDDEERSVALALLEEQLAGRDERRSPRSASRSSLASDRRG